MSLSRRYHVFIATAVIARGEHLPFPRGDVESTVLARRANSSVAECRTKSPVDLRTVKLTFGTITCEQSSQTS